MPATGIVWFEELCEEYLISLLFWPHSTEVASDFLCLFLFLSYSSITYLFSLWTLITFLFFYFFSDKRSWSLCGSEGFKELHDFWYLVLQCKLSKGESSLSSWSFSVMHGESIFVRLKILRSSMKDFLADIYIMCVAIYPDVKAWSQV